MKIKQLDEILANKIAAGEVIERPANVVKELVENSIDASSSKIDIIIEEGGMNLIEIVDDGLGMDQEDAKLCFQDMPQVRLPMIKTSFVFKHLVLEVKQFLQLLQFLTLN